jgi:hypothetical protein
VSRQGRVAGVTCFVVFAGLLVFGVVGYIDGRTARFAPRHALPASATEVREEYLEAFGDDYSYWLKAGMPAADVPAYAAKLGLKPHPHPTRSLQPAHPGVDLVAPAWFDMPFGDASLPCYSRAEETQEERLLWADGYVYYCGVRT